MKNLSVCSYMGTNFEGFWNEKTYSSKKSNTDLVRIYVANQEIHITKDELDRISKLIGQDQQQPQSEVMNNSYEAHHAMVNKAMDHQEDRPIINKKFKMYTSSEEDVCDM